MDKNISSAVEQPTGDLPPLPAPMVATRHGTPCYTVDQMMDYARAAIAAHLARQAQAEPAEEMVRFCPHCARIGEVGAQYRDCCPDGSAARIIPKRLAEVCRDTFRLAIDNVAAQVDPAGAQNEEILALHRQLAAEKLRADQGWERAEAKSKECIELRERMAGAQNAEAIRNAAKAAVADAIEEMRDRVHPCDQNNDEAVARQLPPLMQGLFRALQTGSANTQEGGAFSSEESNELAAYGIDSRKLVKIGELPTQNACAYERDDGSNCECGWPKKTCRNYASAEKGRNNG